MPIENLDPGARPFVRFGLIALSTLSSTTGTAHVTTAVVWPLSTLTLDTVGHVLNTGRDVSENTHYMIEIISAKYADVF